MIQNFLKAPKDLCLTFVWSRVWTMRLQYICCPSRQPRASSMSNAAADVSRSCGLHSVGQSTVTSGAESICSTSHEMEHSQDGSHDASALASPDHSRFDEHEAALDPFSSPLTSVHAMTQLVYDAVAAETVCLGNGQVSRQSDWWEYRPTWDDSADSLLPSVQQLCLNR